MKSLLFLANSFHLKKTGSTNFLIDWLSSEYNVTVAVHKEAWRFVGQKWDYVVCFQHLYRPIELEAFNAEKIILVPMYDDCPKDPSFWKKYKKFLVLSFSKSLAKIFNDSGIRHVTVQYYPEPASISVPEKSMDKGFFWERTPKLTWNQLVNLWGPKAPSKMHIHTAGDSGHQPVISAYTNIELTVSNWFENPQELHQILDHCGIYFAPRREEGIGMSFLEALGRGMCVVAPHRPTMNEYIEHGKNGLLYDPDNPQPLDFSRAYILGQAAYENSQSGYSQWLESRNMIRDFINNEYVQTTKRRYIYYIWRRTRYSLTTFLRKVKRRIFA